MRIVDVPDADAPGERGASSGPEAVALCGSDFHYFLGHLGDAVGPNLYPRVQGHEFVGSSRSAQARRRPPWANGSPCGP